MLRRLIVPVVVVLVVGVALSALIAERIRSHDTAAILREFERDVATRAGLLKREIDVDLEVLWSLVGFYASSIRVDRHEFRTYAIHARARRPDIAALEWVPLIPGDRRAEVEREAQEQGHSGFRFTERDESGQMVEAAERSEYLPVLFIEPLEGNEAAFGFDLASDAKRRAMLDRARDTGEMHATGRLELVQAPEGHFGFLVAQPLFRGHPVGPAEHRASLEGYMLAVYRVSEIYERAMELAGEPDAEIQLSLHDESALGSEGLLYQTPPRSKSALLEDAAVESPVGDVAGRRWVIRAVPTEAYVAARRSIQASASFLGGVVLTGFLAVIVGIIGGRANRVRQLVAVRTRQLSQAKEEVEREHDIVLWVLDSLGHGVAVTDGDGKLTMFNPAAERILGLGLVDSGPQDWTEVYGLYRTDGVTPMPMEELPLARAAAGEEPDEVEMFVRNPSLKGGRFIRVKATPLRDSAGLPRGGVAIFNDITERREAEEARRARELAGHLQSAREHERRHIAREIHDELGQALTGLKLEVSYIARHRGAEAETIRRKLADLGATIDQTIESVRQLAAELRPQLLDELGLNDAIQWQVREFEKRSGIACSLELPSEEIDWGQDQAIAAYRIVQESLTNVARHAGAERVSVKMTLDDGTVTLEIADDGKGISDKEAINERSFGLLGMHERARMYGGVFKVRGRAGEGTTVTVTLPR